VGGVGGRSGTGREKKVLGEEQEEKKQSKATDSMGGEGRGEWRGRERVALPHTERKP
jgi:hypothetical protein